VAKTYWHLAERRRIPDDYEIASSRLLYHPERGFEIDVPLAGWYARHQRGSRLRANDWERFADPARTTFARYTASRDSRETFVDGLLRAAGEDAYHETLPPDWIDALERWLPPARHPLHGLQMIAAYVGQMAPSGRIAIAAAFQAGDELRRVQRFAYRMAQLRRRRPGFGEASLEQWEESAAWQPLRELVERLLVIRDFGEAFVALDLVVKPVIDRLWLEAGATLASRRGDPLFARVLASLAEDARWHRAWAAAAIRVATEDDPSSGEAAAEWVSIWLPRAEAAARAFAPLVADEAWADETLAAITREIAGEYAELGLRG
jgi:toluene monooxygenase system protein E